MKISPLPASGMPMPTPTQTETPSLVQDIRKLRMRTNATPGIDVHEPSVIPDAIEPANAVSEDTRPLSPQYVALAKQRRALQQERQAFEREKAKAIQPTATGVDLARIKSEPLRVLEEAGVSYDQLTEAILANPSQVTPEIRALQAEVKALKEGVDSQFTTRDQQAEQQVLAEMKREALSLASEGDTYEMVRETHSIPDVMKLIERTYREHGEILDVSEAMQLVEDELIKESLKIAQINKVQSRLAPPAPLPQPQNQRPGTRTLTNRDNTRALLGSRARAIAAFNGQLKK